MPVNIALIGAHLNVGTKDLPDPIRERQLKDVSTLKARKAFADEIHRKFGKETLRR